MRSSVRITAIAFLLSGLLGCGPKGAKLQKSVVPPDKTLFETGQEYLKKSQYIKARLAFQTLINTYTDSELSADSYLAIGDSYYNEGGTENLLQAEDQYKNFIIFFPTNPKAVDAQMKIVALNMKMERSPDRDPSYSIKAEAAAKRMLDQFPDSDYVPIVTGYLKEIQERLAQANLGVGKFYADKGNYWGATSRYQEIADRYQNFSLLDETYYRLADALEKTKKPDEAAVYYTRLAQGFPDSKYFDDAKSRLTELGKPVPAVDTQLASLHAPKPKEGEGFTPLKPFISFAEALGFHGPPDRYEEAKKAVEDKKAADALAAAQTAKSTDVAKAGDGMLIEATISKDASGKTESSAVLGGGSGGNQADPNSSAGKKQSTKKSKKKPEKKQDSQ